MGRFEKGCLSCDWQNTVQIVNIKLEKVLGCHSVHSKFAEIIDNIFRMYDTMRDVFLKNVESSPDFRELVFGLVQEAVTRGII